MIFRRLLRAVFVAWIVLWAVFMARELFAKKNMREYARLLPLSLEGKRAAVTGERFYEFLSFCNANLEAGARYRLIGPEEGSLDRRRAVYYLYPRLEDKSAGYTLVYGPGRSSGAGHTVHAMLDAGRFIEKRGP